MIPLNNVTIVSINGRDPENSVKAIEYSSRRIQFAKKILITSPNKIQKYSNIEVFPYEIRNRDEYSYFCIKELHKYIETEYCLIVQTDGFVINPFMWSEDFLQYDYIGAPLVPREVEHALQAYGKLKEGQNFNNLPHLNGCGGFTLRSKKFLTECSKLDYPPKHTYTHNTLAEDFYLCVHKKTELEQRGVVFAPLDIAFKFAIARGTVIDRESSLGCCKINSCTGHTFGFHGAHPNSEKKIFLSLLENPENENQLDFYKNLKRFLHL